MHVYTKKVMILNCLKANLSPYTVRVVFFIRGGFRGRGSVLCPHPLCGKKIVNYFRESLKHDFSGAPSMAISSTPPHPTSKNSLNYIVTTLLLKDFGIEVVWVWFDFIGNPSSLYRRSEFTFGRLVLGRIVLYPIIWT